MAPEQAQFLHLSPNLGLLFKGFSIAMVKAGAGDFAGDFEGGVEDSRISIAEMTEENIDFGVQLLVILHCFSGLISMLEKVEKDNVCLGVVNLESTAGITEKNDDF